jgi:YVTN family beta-propeller protein
MSDFLTELRREVVGAHAAHQRRPIRASRMRRRRPALAGAVALAALIVAIAIAVRSLPRDEPSGEPRVIKVLRLGGIPVDGVFADGSLWVSDSASNRVVRIDAAKRRVVARIPVGSSPEEIAAGPAGIWARGTPADGGTTTRLSRIDPRSNRAARGIDAPGGSALAVGADTVWISRRFNAPERIDGLDRASGRITHRIGVTDTDALALAGGTLWTIQHDGTVLRIDAASGRIARRWPQLAPSSASGDSTEAIVADRAGAWILSTSKAVIFRLEGDRVVKEIPVDDAAEPILARAGRALWTVTGDQPSGRYRLSRLDALTGELTATVDVGLHRPRTLVPVRGGLWVVGGDGTAVLIDT